MTVVTELLEPGGYLRLGQMARRAEAAPGWERATVDVEGVRRLADAAAAAAQVRGARRPPVAVSRQVPLFDCAAAPCVAACPIGQDVPGYLRRVARGDLAGALRVIRRQNPLPALTGRSCEQSCARACTRLHYDQPLRIRELKRAAAEAGAAPGDAASAPSSQAPSAGHGRRRRRPRKDRGRRCSAPDRPGWRRPSSWPVRVGR